MNGTSTLSDNYWEKKLSAEQFNVLRKRGTELPFSGIYDDHFEEGVYRCAACGMELFSSETKYDAGCGWPSFWNAISKENIELKDDYDLGVRRTEVLCKNCGGHLGHVFPDGPDPTGLRYCINSLALDFESLG